MTRADWLVITFALLLLPGLYIGLWSSGPLAQVAKITHRHEQPLEKALTTDQEIAMQGDLGISMLQIKQGKIRFIDSPCRSKVCVHSGWIQSSGQILACLPNGILVELIGGTRKYDAINF